MTAQPAFRRVLDAGLPVFAIAILAFGVETIVCAHVAKQPLGPGYDALPVIPWIPAIPWLAYVVGALIAACGIGILLRATPRASALIVAGIMLLGALLITGPRNVAHPGSIGLRTVVFEPLAIASLAILLPGVARRALRTAACIVLGISLVVFGIDHFLSLAFIAGLIPGWIPWHAFWVAFFGVAFVVAGIGIAANVLRGWSAAAIGLMFAIWVFTLHVPRTLGLYGVPGATADPNEWSSLFIAVALWGGSWALAATTEGQHGLE